MRKESKEFLFELLNTPSPSGMEEAIQQVIINRMEYIADSIETDIHGNLFVGINTDAPVRIMLAGHCDQIALMITHISDKGYLYFSPIGGIDVTCLVGTPVHVHTANGTLPGVIGKTPIHLLSAQERVRTSHDIKKCWIDIGANSKDEAEKLVTPGDSATFKGEIQELENQCIAGPGLDNRVGAFIVMEALRLCQEKNIDVALYAVSTVQEELGVRGAETATYYLDPHVGIAVDVIHSSDNPGNQGKKQPHVALGDGPALYRGPNVNTKLCDSLMQVAKRRRIPHQIAPVAGLLGNDARAIQVSRTGVATASVGVPNRYMHTQVEVCNLTDLTNSAKLLAEFAATVNEKSDFYPLSL